MKEVDLVVKDKVKWGSDLAKKGFLFESKLVDLINDFENNEDGKNILMGMGYNISEIFSCKAKRKSGLKTDVYLEIINKYGEIKNEGIQAKKVSNKKGFNQIDKRWVDKYVEIIALTEKSRRTLKYFTGELLPYIKNGKKRMFMYEFSEEERNGLLNELNSKKREFLNLIFKGEEEKYAPKWMVISHMNEIKMVKIDDLIDEYVKQNFELTKKGSIKLGSITIQRKGGDNGRKTAQMLQVKIAL